MKKLKQHEKHLILPALILLAAAALLIGGCGEQQTEAPPIESLKAVFTYADIDEVESLDPALVSSRTGTNIDRYLFDGLVRMDPDTSEPVPAVAEDWEVEKGATEITFHLRKDVRFSNGDEITADDFIYSWERSVTEGGVDSPARSYLEIVAGADEFISRAAKSISGLDAVDDYTLKVTLTEPMIEFVTNTAHPSLAPVPESLAGNRDFGDEPVGNGPFKLKEAKGKTQFVLEKNRDYYGEPARVDEVVVKVIEDPEKAAKALRDGEIDAMIGLKVEDEELIEELRDDDSLKVPEFEIANLFYVGMNLQEVPWKDNVKLRQALNWAVDREALVEAALNGRGRGADGLLPPGVPGRQKNAMPYGYDVEKAKSLLSEAGYPNGQGLPALALYHAEEPTISLAAHELQAQLKQIGVNVTLSEQQNEVMGGFGNNFNMFLNTYSPFIPSADGFLFPMFHSSYAGMDNETFYTNAEVDALMNQASSSDSVKAELKLYNQAETKILADAPVIPLFFQNVMLPHSERVTNVMRDARGDIVLDRVTVKPE